MADILDASKEKMFIGLVPDSSAKALSRYTEMLDDIIRTQAEKLQQESEVAKARLKEMDLPDMLYALDGTAIIPDHLRDDIEAVQLDGGPPTLEAEMRRLEDLRRVNQELLRHCEEKLQNESREDAQLRAQFGTRWTRPQSSTLAKSLQDSINNYNSKIKQAADVDARIDRMIRDNWETMSILSVKPVSRFNKPRVL
jgi:programmed cell death 6-interacting protein